MKPMTGLVTFVLCASVTLLYAQTVVVPQTLPQGWSMPGTPPSTEPPEVRAAREQEQSFLDAIPHRLELPENERYLETYIIDTKTFEVVRTFDGYLREYWPDLDMVLTEQGYDQANRNVTLWNYSTGEKIRDVRCDWVSTGMDMSPLKIVHRKAILWNAKTQTSQVVDLLTGESPGELPGFVRWISYDNSFLVLQGKNEVSILDPETLKPNFTVPEKWLQQSQDKSRFVAGADLLGEITIYELKTGKKINAIPRGDDYSLNRDATKMLVRNHHPSEVELWDVDTGQKLWTAPFGGKANDLYSFHFSDDGRIITGSCKPRLPMFPPDWPRTYVWNAQSGEEIAMFRDFFDTQGHYLSKAKRMFASISLEDKKSKYVLCDAETGEVIIENTNGYFAAVSKDELRLWTVEGSTLSLWDTETGKLLRTMDIIGAFAKMTEDEQRILTYDKNAMYLWDTETGELIFTIQEENINPYKLSSYAFQIDSTGITATLRKRLDSPFMSQEVLFDINTGEIVARKDILPTNTRFGDIVWNVNDRNNVIFWNMAGGIQTKTPGNAGGIQAKTPGNTGGIQTKTPSNTDGKAIFMIRLPNKDGIGDLTSIGPIHFTPDGSRLIFSPAIRPWMTRVMF
ncbi:MAG: hypothetical protein FWD31_10625 [Planctomycetaceae bacterium]|nr:hypothetical protein [Planctomycetaceae bacterium]